MTHIYAENDYVNCEFDNAQSIELLGVELKGNVSPNVTESATIMWILRESDGSQTNESTLFPPGFYTLEDIQSTLNHDLMYKNCPIKFEFKYQMNRITIFKIKPPRCKIDIFLVGASLMNLMGYTQGLIEHYPAKNNSEISLFPYGRYTLFCDILDPHKNLVNGNPSKMLCYLIYPFNCGAQQGSTGTSHIKKATVKQFSQINFDVHSSAGIKINYFNFFCLING